MKQLLLLCCLAVGTAGCAISTELDPQGSPKYRGHVRATGTNFAKQFDAYSMPNTKTLGNQDDLDRLMRAGGSGPRPGQN